MTDQPVGVPRGWTANELAALGRIVFNFTGLNWCAERLLAGFMPGGETALVAVVPMTMAGKLKKLRARAVTELADGSPEQQALLGWIEGVGHVTEERNGMIHSVWAPGTRDGAMMRIWPRRSKNEWAAERTEVDLRRLDELADHIRKGTEVAVQISVALAACPAWQGEPLT